VSSRLVRSLVHPDRSANLPVVRFDPAGRRLFAAGYPSGVVQVWDAESGKELRRVETPRGYRGTYDYVYLSPDWKTIYVPAERRRVTRIGEGDEDRVRIEFGGELQAWDLTTGEPVPPIKPSADGRSVLVGYLSPAGDRILTVERPSYTPPDRPRDTAVLWDLRTRVGTPLGNGYSMAAFTPDGKTLAVTFFGNETERGRLAVFDAATRRELWSARPTSGDRGFSWPVVSPDGTTLAVADDVGRIDKPATLKLFDLATGKERGSISARGKFPFRPAAFAPDGKTLAVTDYDGGLMICDAATGKVEKTYTFPGMSLGPTPAFSPDGKTLAALAQPVWKEASRADPRDLPQPRVYLFNPAGPAAEPEVVMCPHGYVTGGLTFRPDGKVLAVGGKGAVHLFDVTRK